MRIHVIAIGGSAMHQLALALQRAGHQVSGSDDQIVDPARRNLEEAGLLPQEQGWDPARVTPDVEAVLLGMHARGDNPELRRAQELGLPIHSFPEFISRMSQRKKRVVVGGSHGKTTTTGMILHGLKEAALEADYVVGAGIPGLAHSAALGDAPLLVCEGDEYPSSALQPVPKFFFFAPHVAVLTGIAWDHINVFPTLDSYREAFRGFLDRLEPGATLYYHEEDPELRSLVEAHPRQDIERIGYGLPPHRRNNGTTYLELADTSLPMEVFGRHNLLNAHAAFLVLTRLGVEPATAARSLAGFQGAARRLEPWGRVGRREVFRDFAHSPSKVGATVLAVRERFPGRHLAAALELHTFSSMNPDFWPHFAGCLEGVDEPLVYVSEEALRRKRMPEVDVEALRRAFGCRDLPVVQTPEPFSYWLQEQLAREGTLLLMSSGDYDGVDVRALG